MQYNELEGKSTAGDNVIRKGKTKTLDLEYINKEREIEM
jgi:hypothetical protein